MKLSPEGRQFVLNMIKGLRSGKYKQGRGSCYNPINKCYCAMGVGYAENGIMTVDWHMAEYSGKVEPDDIYRLVTPNVVKWNDRDGLTFNEIADRLEQMIGGE